MTFKLRCAQCGFPMEAHSPLCNTNDARAQRMRSEVGMSWEQKWDLMLARIKKMTDDANRWADYSEKHTRRLGDQQETENEHVLCDNR